MNNTRDEESRKKDSPGAPMVPYEVRQVGWRASEAPERGAPWGADGLGGGGSFNIMDGTRRSPSSKGRNLWPPEAGGVGEVSREALIKFWFRFFKSEALMERKNASMKRPPATRLLFI